jgi:hypothetical protein
MPLVCLAETTAPISSPDASVSIVKTSLKLGIASVGVVVMAYLRARKAVSASSCHPNWPFLRRLLRARAIML